MEAQANESVVDPAEQLSPTEMRLAMDKLRSQQNLPLAVIAGAAAALAGAGAWAAITVLTEHQIGWMAIAVGALVGFAVRVAGKGAGANYAAIGAGFALVGCVIGNLLTVSYFIAVNEGVPYGLVLSALMDPAFTTEVLVATFDPVDIVFYALAVYCGFKYGQREFTDQDLRHALTH